MSKRTFLISTLVLVSILSGCSLILGEIVSYFQFRNRSSLEVDVDITEQASRSYLTLQPGEEQEVNALGPQKDLGYTYTHSNVVETGKTTVRRVFDDVVVYYFWDKGTPRPY